MSNLIEFRQKLRDLKKSLGELEACFDYIQPRMATEYVAKMGCKIVANEEYTQLLSTTTKSKEKADAEVKEEVARELQSLNKELQHKLQIKELSMRAEIDTLKAKLEMHEKNSSTVQKEEDVKKDEKAANVEM